MHTLFTRLRHLWLGLRLLPRRIQLNNQAVVGPEILRIHFENLPVERDRLGGRGGLVL